MEVRRDGHGRPPDLHMVERLLDSESVSYYINSQVFKIHWLSRKMQLIPSSSAKTTSHTLSFLLSPFHHPHLPSPVAYFPAVFSADQRARASEIARVRVLLLRAATAADDSPFSRGAVASSSNISLCLPLLLVLLSSVTAAKIDYLPLKDGATAVAGCKKRPRLSYCGSGVNLQGVSLPIPNFRHY